MLAAAGTLAAFLVGWGTIACKLIFRWGNLQRRRTRFKQPPRIVEFYRWVKKELKGEETLFHAPHAGGGAAHDVLVSGLIGEYCAHYHA